MFDSDQFISIFISEAQEILEGLENDLVLLEDNKTDNELLNKIFRSAHTLKSSAGTVGFDAMSDLNHVAENLLEKVRGGKLDVTADIITVLLDFLDTMKLMLDNIIEGNAETEGVTTIDALKSKIKVLGGGAPAPVEEEKKETPKSSLNNSEVETDDSGLINIFHIKMAFKSNIFDNGIDPIMYLGDLEAVGVITNLSIDAENLPTISNFDDPYICYTKFELDLDTILDIDQLSNIFLFVIDDNDIFISHTASIEAIPKNPPVEEVMKKEAVNETAKEDVDESKNYEDNIESINEAL